jgi:hypothetical protein
MYIYFIILYYIIVINYIIYISTKNHLPPNQKHSLETFFGDFADCPPRSATGQWHGIGHNGSTLLVLSNGGKAQLVLKGFDQTVQSLAIRGSMGITAWLITGWLTGWLIYLVNNG